MAHEFETGFFVRHAAWHGLGVVIENAPNSDEALKIAGLDWDVKQAPACMNVDGKMQPTDFRFNVRSTDNKVLGIVTEQYKIVQNTEAFAFTDALIDSGEVKYNTAGSLADGKRIWLLAEMPETSVLGEAMAPYLLFNNSHDGTSAVRVTMTNTRVVCQNTLNIALANAKRMWSYTHKGDMESKLKEAQDTIRQANLYMKEFSKEADRLAMKKFSPVEVRQIIDTLFPIDDESIGKRKLNNLVYLRQNFEVAMNRPDIEHFRNTAYGILNAVSDFASHTEPLRKTATYREKRLASFMDGNVLLDQAYKLIA